MFSNHILTLHATSMVYSVGSRLMQATPVKVSTAAAPEAYYASALCYMEVIMMLHDIQ